MARFFSITLLVGLLLVSSSMANAKEPWGSGPFLTGSVGAGAIDFDSDLEDIGDLEHTGFTGRFSVGYWFSKYWGVSVSYTDLGDFEQQFEAGVFRGSGFSYGASLLGRWPITDRFALVGRVNLVRSRMKDDHSDGTQFSRFFGEETSVVVPSIEMNFRLTNSLTLLIEFDHRGRAAKDLNVGYAGVGARWQF